MLRPDPVSAMSDPSPRMLAQVVDGARLANVLPYIQAELSELENAVIVRCEQLYNHGDLTPQVTQDKMIELLCYRRLRRKLEQKVRVGISLGEKVAPDLETVGG